jgi:ABC-type transporter Mla MlaB component
MRRPPAAVAIRPGEHACCRFADPIDRERLALAFVLDGLQRGHKVVYLSNADDTSQLTPRLAGADAAVEPAIARGQVDVRAARDTYLDRGAFDATRMVAFVREEHTQALAEGYTGLSLTGEMGWALSGGVPADAVADYERRLDADIPDASSIVLCQYDHRELGASRLSAVALSHGVDASPELGVIGRDGSLSAMRIRGGPTLRLAGELDFGCATALAEVLDGHFHGPLAVDLADLSFVDVAGLRALRGRTGQPLRIAAASDAVHRLLRLMAWDTDPGVEVEMAV